VTLLLRTTRKLQLTEVGSRYFEHAVNACAEFQAAEAATSDEQGEASGLVRLTAPVEMGSTSLADVISAFIEAHPKVQVEILLTDRIVDLIGEGIDLALRVAHLEDSSFIARKIGTTELQAYASPGYLKKHGEPKRPQDLKTHNCLSFHSSVQGTWELNVEGGDTVKIEVKGSAAANNLIAIHRLALSGRGVALLPWFLCAEDVASGRLKQVLKKCSADRYPVHLVYPRQKFVPKRVRVFLDFVAQNLHEFF
jgi:DNA-binding transcriptional LysR family regulator